MSLLPPSQGGVDMDFRSLLHFDFAAAERAFMQSQSHVEDALRLLIARLPQSDRLAMEGEAYLQGQDHYIACCYEWEDEGAQKWLLLGLELCDDINVKISATRGAAI